MNDFEESKERIADLEEVMGLIDSIKSQLEQAEKKRKIIKRI